MDNDKNQKGFTLVELLVYTALLLVVMMLMSSFLVDTIRTSARTLNQKEVSQGLRLAISLISQEIKTSKNVVSVSATSIELLDSDGVDIEFSWDSGLGAIFFDDGTSNEIINDDNVEITNLNFNQDSNGLILLEVEAESKNNPSIGSKVTSQMQALVAPRYTFY